MKIVSDLSNIDWEKIADELLSELKAGNPAITDEEIRRVYKVRDFLKSDPLKLRFLMSMRDLKSLLNKEKIISTAHAALAAVKDKEWSILKAKIAEEIPVAIHYVDDYTRQLVRANIIFKNIRETTDEAEAKVLKEMYQKFPRKVRGDLARLREYEVLGRKLAAKW